MKEVVPLPSPLLKQEDIRKFLDNLDHYLKQKRGLRGTPLDYLVRDEVIPPDPDPLLYNEPSFEEELIRRARHGNYNTYRTDDNALWSIIPGLTVDGVAWG
jgi:hypothetical protein